MKIISWNVNGIRSRIFNENISSKLKKNEILEPQEGSPMAQLLNLDPDIICIQETRCSIENSKKINIPGYNSFFNESQGTGARAADRYSGTAIFYKNTMKLNNVSTQFPGYTDTEGRIIIAEFSDFTCVSVYAPNSGTNYESKSEFQDAALEYLNGVSGPVVFCGDLNVAVDTHFDKSTRAPCPGIYDFELKFCEDLKLIGYTDTKDPEIVFTWWDPRTRKEDGICGSRVKNKGWRLDYFFTKNYNQIECKHLKHIGETPFVPLASDHSPILMTTECHI